MDWGELFKTKYECRIRGCNNTPRKHSRGRYGRLCETHHREKYPRSKVYNARRVVNQRIGRRHGGNPRAAVS